MAQNPLINKGIVIPDQDNLNDNATFLSGKDDPQIIGIRANIGSIYIKRSDPIAIYKKNGTSNFDWVELGQGSSPYQLKEYGVAELQRSVLQFPSLQEDTTQLRGTNDEKAPLLARTNKITVKPIGQINELAFELTPVDNSLSEELIKDGGDPIWSLFASDIVDANWRLSNGQLSNFIELYVKLTFVGGEGNNMSNGGDSVWPIGSKLNVEGSITISRKKGGSLKPGSFTLSCPFGDIFLKEGQTRDVNCELTFNRQIDASTGSAEFIMKVGCFNLSTVFGTGIQDGDNFNLRLKFSMPNLSQNPRDNIRNMLIHNVDLIMIPPLLL